ncbi:tRNA(fMet)-specific endonuclease VapC [Gammaproteobacteria bacterium]
MNGYLLDSNICIAWLKNNRVVVQRLIVAGEHQVYLCSPVKAELWFGACKSQRSAENQANLTRFFNYFISLPFDDQAALLAGNIRAQLAGKGTPIGPYDLQIAAIALAHELVLVTHNTREFSRVPELLLEDWLG